jgi:hypothetical protein
MKELKDMKAWRRRRAKPAGGLRPLNDERDRGTKDSAVQCQASRVLRSSIPFVIPGDARLIGSVFPS